MKFRAKETIKAEQFLPPHKIPKGVFNVYEMTEGVFGQIETTEGRKYIISGIWIAEEPSYPGKYYPIYDNVIQEKYEPVLPASLSNTKDFNVSEKRKVRVISGDQCFEGEVTAMEWEVDQWIFKINGMWYCQSEIYPV